MGKAVRNRSASGHAAALRTANGERDVFVPFSTPLKVTEPLDDIGRFLASLRFEQRGKLNQLGIEITAN